MKKIFIFLFSILTLSACACSWDKGGGGGGGGSGGGTETLLASSNIYVQAISLDNVTIGAESGDWFRLTNTYGEDADLLVRMDSSEGSFPFSSSDGVFTINGSDSCVVSDGYFTIPAGGYCDFLYTFKPKEYKYYSYVFSLDLIGKSFFENGDTLRKKRMDVYFQGSGVPSGQTPPTVDAILDFNGINRYFYDEDVPAGFNGFEIGYLDFTVENDSGSEVIYELYEGDSPYDRDSSEFKITDNSSCASTDNFKSLTLPPGGSCNLGFNYVPSSKKEKSVFYLKPRERGYLPVKTVLFFGGAYTVKSVNVDAGGGHNLDWGAVGVNLVLADTVLDLKGRINRGEDLTINFDNLFDAYIFLKPADDSDLNYTLDFGQATGFIIDDNLTDCSINGNTVSAPTEAGCGIAVAFRPTEQKTYNGSLSLTSQTDSSKTFTYTFTGSGILMKRAKTVDDAISNSFLNNEPDWGKNWGNVNIGKTSFLGIDLKDNATYFYTGDVAFRIEELYPGCKIESTRFVLEKGTSCRVYVVFNPPTQGSYSGTLTITEGSLDTVNYNLSGSGV